MSLVKSNELLTRAMQEHYAVPSFNANCFEMVPALIHAAESEHAPIIIQIGKKYLSYTPADEIGALALHL
ncbi:MAG: class II fructose-bisphosphate aldolase, partial [Fusicatenibacter sp.]